MDLRKFDIAKKLFDNFGKKYEELETANSNDLTAMRNIVRKVEAIQRQDPISGVVAKMETLAAEIRSKYFVKGERYQDGTVENPYTGQEYATYTREETPIAGFTKPITVREQPGIGGIPRNQVISLIQGFTSGMGIVKELQEQIGKDAKQLEAELAKLKTDPSYREKKPLLFKKKYMELMKKIEKLQHALDACHEKQEQLKNLLKDMDISEMGSLGARAQELLDEMEKEQEKHKADAPKRDLDISALHDEYMEIAKRVIERNGMKIATQDIQFDSVYPKLSEEKQQEILESCLTKSEWEALQSDVMFKVVLAQGSDKSGYDLGKAKVERIVEDYLKKRLQTKAKAHDPKGKMAEKEGEGAERIDGAEVIENSEELTEEQIAELNAKNQKQ